jgi:hypothetical protein
MVRFQFYCSVYGCDRSGMLDCEGSVVDGTYDVADTIARLASMGWKSDEFGMLCPSHHDLNVGFVP